MDQLREVLVQLDLEVWGRPRRLVVRALHLIEQERAGEETQLGFGFYDEAFSQRILKLSPSLTPAEVRVCALIRIQMTSKEIAHVLSISSHTVDTHRRRIRRKLALGLGQNISIFLASL